MKSEEPGTNTSGIEVAGITIHGIWLLIDGHERFLGFEYFPWFKGAAEAEVRNVERPQPHHLYWPDLDVDLHVDAIEHPEKYPRVAKRRP